MKTLVVSLGLITAVAAAAAFPATAAPKCKAGTSWSKSAGKCLAKSATKKPATVKKAQANCLSFDAGGGVSSSPCAK
jgi:adenosine/AMP kinase